ncbi:MAG: hypothetical protein ABIG63_10345 [Chloroflexota bacterium]|nr:hypothetical protein [Pseudomonadota bacterium]
MLQIRHLWPGVLSFMLLLTLMLTTTRPTEACEPWPDYWFVETFAIESGEWPEAITVAVSPESTVRGYLSIENNSATPLYILPRAARQHIIATEEPIFAWEGMLAEESAAEEYLLSDQVPGLAAYILTAGQYASLTLYIKDLPTLDPRLEDRNVLDFTRLGFVEMPAGQRSELLLVYDGDLYEITFTISYKLNPNFAPGDCSQEDDNFEATKAAKSAHTNAQTTSASSLLVMGIILILVFGIVGWLNWQARSS